MSHQAVHFKNILVTTDLSDHSKHAFPVARGMAEAFQDSTVHVLAVIGDAGGFAGPLTGPQVRDEIVSMVRKGIEAKVKLYFSGLPRVKYDIREHASTATAQEIVDFANENDIDCIIMSTHGRTGLSHMIIGSVAERVVRHARCPVLTVPAHFGEVEEAGHEKKP